MINAVPDLVGRALVALDFFGGAIQKLTDPSAVQQMIAGIGLPACLVWLSRRSTRLPHFALCLAAKGPGKHVWPR